MSDMSELDLRWQLRQLPREITPTRDLWPDIAARLPPLSQLPRKSRRPLWQGLAIAASLSLAVGIAWFGSPESGSPPSDPQARLVEGEANAMIREYQSALAQLGPLGQLDPPDTQALHDPALTDRVRSDLATLDHSADSIRAALKADPDSTFLLEQLKRTYARRLSLTQRALAS